jgi:hypothetical protein
MENPKVSEYTAIIYSENLEIPHNIDDAEKAEKYFRERYPGIQIRFAGLMYSEFPHEKRIPYINILIDGSGYPIGASRFYIK